MWYEKYTKKLSHTALKKLFLLWQEINKNHADIKKQVRYGQLLFKKKNYFITLYWYAASIHLKEIYVTCIAYIAYTGCFSYRSTNVEGWY